MKVSRIDWLTALKSPMSMSAITKTKDYGEPSLTTSTHKQTRSLSTLAPTSPSTLRHTL